MAPSARSNGGREELLVAPAATPPPGADAVGGFAPATMRARRVSASTESNSGGVRRGSRVGAASAALLAPGGSRTFASPRVASVSALVATGSPNIGAAGGGAGGAGGGVGAASRCMSRESPSAEPTKTHEGAPARRSAHRQDGVWLRGSGKGWRLAGRGRGADADIRYKTGGGQWAPVRSLGALWHLVRPMPH